MRSNKVKDMIRSVLPSTFSGYARAAKKGRKRELRRGIRQQLRTEDFDETKADLNREARLSDVVWGRRLGDKISHFMRWCRARTEGMDTDDALSYVRSVLPSNVIGDHEYGHWEDVRKPRPYRRPWPDEPAQSLQSYIDSTTCRLKRALAIAPDLHQALNASIKREKLEGAPRRTLGGIHDVEAFVRHIAWPDKRGEDDLFAMERRVTRDLIERIEKGGREAALGVLTLRDRAARFLNRVPFAPAIAGEKVPKADEGAGAYDEPESQIRRTSHLPRIWRSFAALRRLRMTIGKARPVMMLL